MSENAVQALAAGELTALDREAGFLVVLAEVNLAILLPHADAGTEPRQAQHLARLPKGAVVPCNILVETPDRAFLVASPSSAGDVLSSLDPDAEPEAFAAGVAAWFAVLGLVARENDRSAVVPTTLLDETGAVILPAGGTVGTRGELVWSRWQSVGDAPSNSGTITLAGAVLFPELPSLPLPVGAGVGLTTAAAVTVTPLPVAEVVGTPAGRAAISAVSAAMVAAIATLLDQHARIRAAQRADRWARMDVNFRRSLTDFEPLLRGRFKRRLPEVEAQPPLIRAACRVLEAGGMKPFTDFVAKPDEAVPDALARFAADSAVRLRPVRLSGDWVHMLHDPLLVQLRPEPGGEPELLPLFKDWCGSLYVELPKDGGRRLRLTSDLKARIEPVAYSFQPILPAGKLTYREIVQFALKHARWSLAEIAAWGVLSAILGLGTPLVFGLIVSIVIPTRDLSLLATLIGALVVTAAMLGALRFAGDIAQLRLDGRLGLLVHGAMVDRLLRLPATVLRTQPSLILATQLETVEKFRRGVTQQMIVGGLAAIHLVVTSGFLLFYNTVAGLIALGLSVVLVLVTYAIGQRQFEAIYEGERVDVVVLAFVYDLIRLLPVLRANGAERLAFTQWAQNFLAFQSRLNRSVAISNIMGVFEAGWGTAIYIAVFATLALTAQSGQPGGITAVAVAVAFVAGLEKLVRAAYEMSHAVAAYAKLLPQAKLARSFIEHTLEVSAGRVPVGTLSGAIELAGVSFAYSGGSLALSDISLRIKPGSFVGIVGSSGSGKSTLVRLMLGLEEPRGGAIYLDGRDMATLDRRLVRRQIGAVLQHSRLFPGSLFENIRGATALGLDEAWEVAELAGIADEVRKFPMGLHTLVGEDGAGLSGGQVQRTLLARALAAHPCILILDEATSALDQTSQDRFIETLRRLTATRIMVTHRFSTLRDCDDIIVLDRGRIIDRGAFDELAGREGPFRAMLERQTMRIGTWGGGMASQQGGAHEAR